MVNIVIVYELKNGKDQPNFRSVIEGANRNTYLPQHDVWIEEEAT